MARTLYISPSGDDVTGDGSIGTPWASISKFLASSPAEGDTLYCRGGTYSGDGNVNQYVTGIVGSSTGWIKIQAYPGETPVFDGGDSSYVDFMVFEEGSAYWVVDGLKLQNFHCTQSGVLWVGSSDAGTPTHHITVRRCNIVRPLGLGQNEHSVYASYNSHDILVELNIFKGTYPTEAITGKAINQYHYPASQDLVVRNNVFDGWLIAFQVWDDSGSPTATGSLLHNTFVNCDLNIDLREHSTFVVRDNAGETGPNGDISDPNDSADTTADHNFWGQTVSASPNYRLTAGDGIGAASDGGDAGWNGAISAVSTYSTAVLADSPVAYWRFGEASGNPVDSAGSNDVTTVAGSPAYGEAGALLGDADTAIKFDGSSTYLEVDDDPSLDLGDGPMSVEFWIKRTDTNAGETVILQKGANTYCVTLGSLTSGKLCLAKSNVAIIVEATTAIADTEWHHVVVTKDGATSAIYLDGADATGSISDATLADTGLPLQIGVDVGAASGFTNATLDEVALYNTALSGARVLAHYQAGTVAAAASRRMGYRSLGLLLAR